MSRQSALRARHHNSSSSDAESLPEEWGSVQKRLEFVQGAIVKLQKRHQKLQKRIESNDEQLSAFRKDFKKKIEEIFKDQNNQMAQKQRELEIENMRGELEELHSFMKRIEKKNHQMFKQIKNGGGFGVSALQDTIEDKVSQCIQDKLQKNFQKNKTYIDRAVAEMKSIIKQYAKDQVQSENKIIVTNDMSHSNSKSRLSNQHYQKSANKNTKRSNARIEIINPIADSSVEEKRKCKSPRSNDNNGSSRVSYLREKLKQFEQINKKYEEKTDKTDKKVVVREEERGAVQKMKDIKNYLQQSESEMDQSNLQIKENNVLSDSGKKWKSGSKYRFE